MGDLASVPSIVIINAIYDNDGCSHIPTIVSCYTVYHSQNVQLRDLFICITTLRIWMQIFGFLQKVAGPLEVYDAMSA